MTIKFERQVIKNPDGKIKYRIFNKGGKEHFHIGVWLDADVEQLKKIESVQYELHPSFKRSVRQSRDRENKFSVTIWTWGMFNITATINYTDGSNSEHSYYLSYDLPADTGENYILID